MIMRISPTTSTTSSSNHYYHYYKKLFIRGINKKRGLNNDENEFKWMAHVLSKFQSRPHVWNQMMTNLGLQELASTTTAAMARKTATTTRTTTTATLGGWLQEQRRKRASLDLKTNVALRMLNRLDSKTNLPAPSTTSSTTKSPKFKQALESFPSFTLRWQRENMPTAHDRWHDVALLDELLDDVIPNHTYLYKVIYQVRQACQREARLLHRQEINQQKLQEQHGSNSNNNRLSILVVRV